MRLDADRFGVHVREGNEEVDVEMQVPPDLADELGVDAEPDELVRESVAFLLEREPVTAIPGLITPDAISRSYEDYYDEIYDVAR